MADHAELIAAADRLRARLADFDSDAHDVDERADLWTEIEVEVNDLRAILQCDFGLGGHEPSCPKVSTLRQRNEELERALEPFAEFARHIAENKPGWNHDDFKFAGPLTETSLTMGDFRRARAARDRRAS